MPEYCLYGTKVRADIDLFDAPETHVAPRSGQCQPLVLRKHTSQSTSRPVRNRQPLYQAHGRALWSYGTELSTGSHPGELHGLEVEGVVDFCFVGGEPTVFYRILEKGSPELMAFWFIHTFLPMYLSIEHGCDFLHASCVEVDARSILFLAPTTGGKSTLAAYFLGQGHPMLADDKLAVARQGAGFIAISSHPYHRPFRRFEVLGRPIEHLSIGAKPVHVIYTLERGEPESATEISEISGLRKFEQLMPHYLFHHRSLQARRARWMSGLVDGCPVFRVKRPWNMARMHEVYEAICTHSREQAPCELAG